MITVLTLAEGVRMIDGIVLLWRCFCGNDSGTRSLRGCEDDWWSSLSVVMFVW